MLNELATAILGPLAVAAVTAVASFFFTKRHYTKLRFSQQMKNYGFSESSTKKLTRLELRDIRENAREEAAYEHAEQAP